MEYAIVVERSESGFGAYGPDLPGCVAVGETEEDVRALIREAVEFHLDIVPQPQDPEDLLR
jgi:predicted RNase H-like HicB family nuclease